MMVVDGIDMVSGLVGGRVLVMAAKLFGSIFPLGP